MARVENIVDDQYVPVGDIRQQIEIELERTGRGGAAIAGRLHQAHLQRHIEQTNQIGQQHDAAGQHANDRQRYDPGNSR